MYMYCIFSFQLDRNPYPLLILDIWNYANLFIDQLSNILILIRKYLVKYFYDCFWKVTFDIILYLVLYKCFIYKKQIIFISPKIREDLDIFFLNIHPWSEIFEKGSTVKKWVSDGKIYQKIMLYRKRVFEEGVNYSLFIKTW